MSKTTRHNVQERAPQSPSVDATMFIAVARRGPGEVFGEMAFVEGDSACSVPVYLPLNKRSTNKEPQRWIGGRESLQAGVRQQLKLAAPRPN